MEEIKEELKAIKELLENPKRLLDNEKFQKKPYHKNKEITLRNPNSPATEKQKDTLLKFKYNRDIDELTQIEASELIKTYLKGGK